MLNEFGLVIQSPMDPNVIADRLQREVDRIAQLRLDPFVSEGSFLFIEDPFTRFLEPVLDSRKRSYELLDAVASTYGPSNEPRQERNSIADAGIASVANQDGDAFSQDPANDFRFGSHSQALHNAYGIRGSLMAVRLDDEAGMPLGVVVVHSAYKITGLTRAEELELIDKLRRTELSSLRQLLQLHREAMAHRELECCQQFLVASYQSARAPKTVVRSCADALDRCISLFEATGAFVFVENSEGPGTWYPTLNPTNESVLNKLRAQAPLDGVFILNRPRQNALLSDELRAAFGDTYVWCCISRTIGAHTLTYLVYRKAEKVLRHWQHNDVALLSHALEVHGMQLSRFQHFSRLLSTLDGHGKGQRLTERFEFLALILRDLLGVDQVLLARVKKKPGYIKICAELTTGFGPFDADMKNAPKEYRPGTTISCDSDIMVHIVADYDTDSLRDVYELLPDDPRLDRKLIEKCELCGNIYFVPCCEREHGSDKSPLLAILHVGSHDGTVILDIDSQQLLSTVGERVAEWLVNERDREMRDALHSVQAMADCNYTNVVNVCKLTSTATASYGCTLYLQADYLHLIGAGWASRKVLSDGVTRLLNKFEEWPSLLGKPACTKLLAVFASFIGVPVEVARARLVQSAFAKDIGRLASEVLYVRAAQSNHTVDNLSFSQLLENRDDLDRDVFVTTFGGFFADNIYLPGHGLTGWVLRYGYPLCLSDKSSQSIVAAHQRLATRREPYWRFSLLRVLNSVGIHDSHLQSEEPVLPIHADHISEDPQRVASHDSYIAFPIEGFETIDRPVGVLRVSNSSRLYQMISPADEMMLSGAARHLSHWLRREFMRHTSYLAGVLGQRGDEDEIDHCMKNLNNALPSINAFLSQDGPTLQLDQRKGIEDAARRLRKACDSARARPQQRQGQRALCVVWASAAV